MLQTEEVVTQKPLRREDLTAKQIKKLEERKENKRIKFWRQIRDKVVKVAKKTLKDERFYTVFSVGASTEYLLVENFADQRASQLKSQLDLYFKNEPELVVVRGGDESLHECFVTPSSNPSKLYIWKEYQEPTDEELIKELGFTYGDDSERKRSTNKTVEKKVVAEKLPPSTRKVDFSLQVTMTPHLELGLRHQLKIFAQETELKLSQAVASYKNVKACELDDTQITNGAVALEIGLPANHKVITRKENSILATVVAAGYDYDLHKIGNTSKLYIFATKEILEKKEIVKQKEEDKKMKKQEIMNLKDVYEKLQGWNTLGDKVKKFVLRSLSCHLLECEIESEVQGVKASSKCFGISYRTDQKAQHVTWALRFFKELGFNVKPGGIYRDVISSFDFESFERTGGDLLSFGELKKLIDEVKDDSKEEKNKKTTEPKIVPKSGEESSTRSGNGGGSGDEFSSETPQEETAGSVEQKTERATIKEKKQERSNTSSIITDTVNAKREYEEQVGKIADVAVDVFFGEGYYVMHEEVVDGLRHQRQLSKEKLQQALYEKLLRKL